MHGRNGERTEGGQRADGDGVFVLRLLKIIPTARVPTPPHRAAHFHRLSRTRPAGNSFRKAVQRVVKIGSFKVMAALAHM